ncbi:hypothetical protein [Microvirgula aerodenitrificans]|uniref:hypothetical protein n=1 Tax=Microvirgula aerodenitrificans TaxID=57480 RepID=UPI00131F3FD8|nr:hypothetical protein [Microvirgula aerodenitrificans]
MNTALPALLGILLAVASTSAAHAQPDIGIGSLYDYLPGHHRRSSSRYGTAAAAPVSSGLTSGGSRWTTPETAPKPN